jgi:hypothetical protein
MKAQLSGRWSKWAAPGIAFTAIVMAAPPEREISMAAQPPAPKTGAASAPAQNKPRLTEAHVELERLARLQSQPEASAAVRAERHAVIGRVFGATSWYVPPPPPPPQPPAPPPAPTAPPMPFTYLGLYEDAPTRLVILVNGGRMYTVAEGDVIDDTYRIERVTAGHVELTYLPLNIKQFINTGEAL